MNSSVNKQEKDIKKFTAVLCRGVPNADIEIDITFLK